MRKESNHLGRAKKINRWIKQKNYKLNQNFAKYRRVKNTGEVVWPTAGVKRLIYVLLNWTQSSTFWTFSIQKYKKNVTMTRPASISYTHSNSSMDSMGRVNEDQSIYSIYIQPYAKNVRLLLSLRNAKAIYENIGCPIGKVVEITKRHLEILTRLFDPNNYQ